MSKVTSRLLFNWGVNDVDYNITKNEFVDQKWKIVWICPYYVKWKSILQRCLDTKFQLRRPTYMGCTVCDEWKYLSNFIKWVDSQPNKDWVNCEPDKDFLVRGNKHYSPESVIFISQALNNFIINSKKTRGDYLIGTSSDNSGKNPYKVFCSNPFTGKQEYLGRYSTELEAHLVWQAKKHEHALRLVDLQDDLRVASRLREIYAPDKDWSKV